MADEKVSDLSTQLAAAVVAADLLYTVDVSETTAGSKKITIDEFRKALIDQLLAQSALTTPDNADSLFLYDEDATAQKKITYSNLQNSILTGQIVKQIDIDAIARQATGAGYTALPLDDTVPQISEGSQVWSYIFSPVSATSKVLVIAFVQLGESSTDSSFTAGALFSDQSTDAINVRETHAPSDAATARHQGMCMLVGEVDSDGSDITFSIRCGNSAANGFTIGYAMNNGSSDPSTFYSAAASASQVIMIEYEEV